MSAPTSALHAPHLRVFPAEQNDRLAAPLLAELAIEYSARYGGTAGAVHHELVTYPAHEFAAPGGELLILVEDGEPVAGGAFRRYDENTAELKRVWTAREHRRRGLGRRVIEELEVEITSRGYRRIYLTTGWRQPEAIALYLAAGYTALYDPEVAAEQIGLHAFEKRIS